MEIVQVVYENNIPESTVYIIHHLPHVAVVIATGRRRIYHCSVVRSFLGYEKRTNVCCIVI